MLQALAPTAVEPVSLQALLAGFAPVAVANDNLISGISSDSRQLRGGDLFLALSGEQHHGLDFLPQVHAAGAAAVAWEPPYRGTIGAVQNNSCPLVVVPNLKQKLGAIADRFYRQPSRRLQLVGVTGTDGKTSCSHFIAQCLRAYSSGQCGVLGTLGYGLYGQLQRDTLNLTTPDAITVRRWLAECVAAKANYAVMEVSSHGLAQGRVDGVNFAIAVLTNLTRDHLDYHGDLAAYSAAKRRLFTACKPRWVVLNLDDSFGQSLANELSSQTVVYGLGGGPPTSAEAFVWGTELQLSNAGLQLQVQSSWGKGVIESALLGRFNASNLLATLAVLLILQIPFAEALQRLQHIHTAPGRMERFGGHSGLPLAVVDYAHTPHALAQALRALREHTYSSGKLWCVFGCGGDRDAGKRPLMGANAERWADRLIITNDNPRTEPPERIASDILAGMRRPERVQVLLDRRAAIAQALAVAKSGDSVLIAGKGHENYQLLGDERIAFSDRSVVQQQLERAA